MPAQRGFFERCMRERQQTPRRAERSFDDEVECIGREHQAQVAAAAGAREPMREQRARIRRTERREIDPSGDAVSEIAAFVDLIAELTLTEEHDVEQLAFRHVEIEQEPQRLEVLVTEILRFIDEQGDGRAVDHGRIVEEVLERILQRGRRARRKRQAERAADRNEKFDITGEARVENLAEADVVAIE